ncbi:MAG: MBL fold metallo-hydrolase [Candidatus Eisenbacteria bacterium]
MRIVRQDDRLVQLTWFGLVNAWLVREEDDFTLVDTGLPGGAADIVRAAERLGAPIARIALTHGHIDAVGGLEGLRALLPEALLSIARREARLLQGDRRGEPGEPSFSPGPYFPRLPVVADRLLDVGDRVGSLLMIRSPGHTPGHVSWLDLRDRTLLAGDALEGIGRLGTSGFVRPWFPFASLTTWDRATAWNSARLLATLRPSRLAPGHGDLILAPMSALEEALAPNGTDMAPESGRG